jgi:hypothetical protein
MSFQDIGVTRWSGGVTNVSDTNIFNSLKEPDPTLYHSLNQDFDTFTVAQFSVGGVGTPTRAQVAGLGGVVALGTSAADNDNSWLQTINPTFQIVAGKKIFFRARFNVSDATQSDIALGLEIAVAANNFLTPVNGIFLRKDDDSTSIALVSRAASVETISSTMGTIVTATNHVVSFFYDGVSTLFAQLDSNGPVSISPVALPSVLMGLTAALQNGDAVVRALNVDQLIVIQER